MVEYVKMIFLHFIIINCTLVHKPMNKPHQFGAHLAKLSHMLPRALHEKLQNIFWYVESYM